MIPLLQFSVLNAMTSIECNSKAYLNKLNNEFKCLSSKLPVPHEAEDFIDDLKKKMAKYVRSKVTGGDILRIDDFAIDLNNVTSHKITKRESKMEIFSLKMLLKNSEPINDFPDRKPIEFLDIEKTHSHK